MTKFHWPLVLAIGILLVVTGLQVALSIKQNSGHFLYALDDAYIHMAIARNFARYGVWGVTRYEFSSSTSSLLWTLLLAAVYLFTLSPFVPLVINIVCAVLLLILANSLLQVDVPDLFARFGILIALVFLTPLPALILTGMEHTAQIASTLLLSYSAASVIAENELSFRKANTKTFLLMSALAPLIRYESLFIIFAAIVLLALRRRFLAVFIASAVSLAPLLIYGFISWKNGSFFLPNPLLLKGNVPTNGLVPFFRNTGERLLSGPHLLFLWLLAIYFLSQRRVRRLGQRERILLTIFILATTLHFLLADIGWFYRYEAYLIALGIIINGQSAYLVFAGLKDFSPRRRNALLPSLVAVVLSVGAGLLLLFRATRAIHQTLPATRSIYKQHYQMASFLREHYTNAAVAANDIGAINFFADLHCLDLVGLGSAEVTRAKLSGQYNTRTMAELAQKRRVKLAVVYSSWFATEGGVPREWIKVGQWTTPNCVVCGNPEVSFYAVDGTEAETLKKNLRNFSSQLPADVAQAGPYCESNE